MSQCDQFCEELIENPTIAITYTGTDPIFLHSTFRHDREYAAPWLASANSPHLAYFLETGNCWLGNYDVNSGTPYFNCLAAAYTVPSQEGYSEGIMQDVEFVGDGYSKYYIEVEAALVDCLADLDNIDMVLRAANGLVHEQNYVSTGMPFTFPGNDVEVIEDVAINSYVGTEYCFEYVPSANYSQFEIISKLGPEDIDVNNIEKQNAGLTIHSVQIQCESSAISEISANTNDLVAMFDFTNLSTSSISEFAWDFGDGNMSTEASPTHVYDYYGIYDVCLDYVTESACCGTICKRIFVSPPPIPCIGDEDVLFLDGTNSNADKFSDLVSLGMFDTGGLLSNQTIVVRGSFLLDVDFTFSKCQVYFEPGAELIVESAGNITIKGSTLQGCTHMWRGITVSGTGSQNIFNFFGNTISDAEYALSIGDQSNIQQSGNTYDTNFIGIYCRGSQGPVVHYGSPVYASTFISTRTMLPPFTNQVQWSDKTVYGIHVDNINFLEVKSLSVPFGPPYVTLKNLFKGIYNGIICSRSVVRILENEFDEIGFETPSDPQSAGSGTAVYVSGSPFCYVSNNVMTKVRNGILCTNSMITRTRVMQNQISLGSNWVGNYRGIQVKDMRNGELLCTYNEVASDNVNGTAYPYELEDFNNVAFKFENNRNIGSGENYRTMRMTELNDGQGLVSTFVGNQFLNGNNIHNSLLVRSVSQVRFFDNDFYSDGGASVVSFNFASNNQFTDNRLFSAPPLGLNHLATASLENLYCCNILNNGRGIQFNGQCDMTNLHTNTFLGTSTGLLLYEGDISDQSNKGNLWQHQGGGSTLARIVSDVGNELAIAESSTFRVEPSVPGVRPTVVLPSSLTDEWFDGSGNGTPTCATSANCDVEEFQYQFVTPSSGSSFNDCDKFAAFTASLSDDVLGGYYEAQNTWLRNYHLYSRLSRLPTSAWDDCDTLFNFMDTLSIVPQFVDLGAVKNGVWNLSAAQNAQASQIGIDIDANISQLDLAYNQIADGALYTDVQGNIISALSQIENLKDASVSISDQVVSNAMNTLPSILTSMQNLPSTFYFLDDLKYVRGKEIEIMLSGASSVSVNEWNALRAIANKCPIDFGQAVNEAQLLLANINEYNFPDVQSACANPSRRSEQSSSEIASIALYPNPSSGVVVLDIGAEARSNYTVVVRNTMGKIVNRQLLKTNTNTCILDLQTQPVGLYFVEVKDGATVVQQSKIVIVK